MKRLFPILAALFLHACPRPLFAGAVPQNPGSSSSSSNSATLPLLAGDTGYVQIGQMLQAGSTFYVSSGTVLHLNTSDFSVTGGIAIGNSVQQYTLNIASTTRPSPPPAGTFQLFTSTDSKFVMQAPNGGTTEFGTGNGTGGSVIYPASSPVTVPILTVSTAAGQAGTYVTVSSGGTQLVGVTGSSIALNLPTSINGPLNLIGAGSLVIATTNSANNLVLNVGSSSMTVTNSSFSFSTPIGVSSMNVTGNLVVNSFALFSTSMTGVNMDTTHVVIGTATVAASTTLTVTPARCTTLVSLVSLSIYNSAASAAGGVEFGAYAFGNSTFPIINRDITDAKNVVYAVLCK